MPTATTPAVDVSVLTPAARAVLRIVATGGAAQRASLNVKARNTLTGRWTIVTVEALDQLVTARLVEPVVGLGFVTPTVLRGPILEALDRAEGRSPAVRSPRPFDPRDPLDPLALHPHVARPGAYAVERDGAIVGAVVARGTAAAWDAYLLRFAPERIADVSDPRGFARLEDALRRVQDVDDAARDMPGWWESSAANRQPA